MSSGFYKLQENTLRYAQMLASGTPLERLWIRSELEEAWAAHDSNWVERLTGYDSSQLRQLYDASIENDVIGKVALAGEAVEAWLTYNHSSIDVANYEAVVANPPAHVVRAAPALWKMLASTVGDARAYLEAAAKLSPEVAGIAGQPTVELAALRDAFPDYAGIEAALKSPVRYERDTVGIYGILKDNLARLRAVKTGVELDAEHAPLGFPEGVAPSRQLPSITDECKAASRAVNNVQRSNTRRFVFCLGTLAATFVGVAAGAPGEVALIGSSAGIGGAGTLAHGIRKFGRLSNRAVELQAHRKELERTESEIDTGITTTERLIAIAANRYAKECTPDLQRIERRLQAFSDKGIPAHLWNLANIEAEHTARIQGELPTDSLARNSDLEAMARGKSSLDSGRVIASLTSSLHREACNEIPSLRHEKLIRSAHAAMKQNPSADHQSGLDLF